MASLVDSYIAHLYLVSLPAVSLTTEELCLPMPLKSGIKYEHKGYVLPLGGSLENQCLLCHFPFSIGCVDWQHLTWPHLYQLGSQSEDN